jgi:hypothetical protein
MARLYAQLFTLVFFVAGVGGLLVTGLHSGSGGGNVGSLTLHLTWFRDFIYIGLLAVSAYVGFVADRHTGRVLIGVAGVLLLVLAIAGFVIGDDSAGSKGAAGLHFPVAVNVFDVVAGALAVLCSLGTIEDETEPT